jgi:hypothetical protein
MHIVAQKAVMLFELFNNSDKFNTNSDDEIAMIPDLDDVQEEELATQIAAPPRLFDDKPSLACY